MRAAAAAASPVLRLTLALALAVGVWGCAPAPAPDTAAGPGDTTADGADRGSGGGTRHRPGTVPTALEFLFAYENEVTAPYYPIDGIAGCAYSPDGTLIICDENRGRVLGQDPRSLQWFEFDHPGVRPYRPVDAQVDGFKVLVLDNAGGTVQRFDLSGAWLDRALDVDAVDPTSATRAGAFAIDRDGRLAITDVSEQQVLLLDTFLELNMRVGQPGSLADQFETPAGIAFLADGGFVVADQGNRRLCRYDRMGFYLSDTGGVFDTANAFVAPQGVGTDRFGNVFVADAGSGMIHVLDRELNLLFSAGRDFGLKATPLGPVDVAVGPDDKLAVADRARAAVLIYRLIYE